MFEANLVVASICIGAVLASLIVGLCLRYILGNPKLRVRYREIVIILGAFGVFFTIFGWSWMLSLNPNLGHTLPILGFAVLYSLIFGIVVTSGLNRKKNRRRKW